jgi:hypothetical protein
MRVAISKEILTSIHSLSVSVSKDDIAPVITQIALVREGNALRAMATDRYMVTTGKYSLGSAYFDDWADGMEILVDPKSLKSVVDIAKRGNGDAPISIVCSENNSVHAEINGVTSAYIGGITGAFPPVMRLFPRDTEANGAPVMNLRPDFIAKLAKVLPPVARPLRERLWRFEFRSDAESGGKPQPLYAVYSDGEEYELEALIQPALIR